MALEAVTRILILSIIEICCKDFLTHNGRLNKENQRIQLKDPIIREAIAIIHTASPKAIPFAINGYTKSWVPGGH